MKNFSLQECHKPIAAILRKVGLYNPRRWALENTSHPLQSAGKTAKHPVTDPKPWLSRTISPRFNQGVGRDLAPGNK
ncbi:MAG: hypothetical protein CMJ89_08820 [Planctomycetes bacterium]|jgi:hypothetical protein|nr:hypothetical protein [Planctomycetota bacterium]